MAAVGDVRGGAGMWHVALGLALTLIGYGPTHAGYDLRRVSLIECEASYLVVEPDVGVVWKVEVSMVHAERAWTYTYTLPSEARCREFRNLALDFQKHSGAQIKVGECL